MATATVAVLAVFGSPGAPANDFPTLARVEFALRCMELNGGQSYDTMYSCVCMIDALAEKYAYEDYTQAQTLSFLYGTPGEKGGVFRDAAPDSRNRIKALEASRDAAAQACFVKRLVAPE
ncbi:MAG: hypothetical protein ACR2RB_01480 [Gammaproteobacteria bacterium]